MHRERSRFLGSLCVILAPLVPVSAPAAPGDEVARIRLTECVMAPSGLAFDGTQLYYTRIWDPEVGTIHRVEAATGEDKGTIIVKDGGVPVGRNLGGLAYDPNRHMVWAGGDNLYGIDIETGEILIRFQVTDTKGIEAAAYDPWLDVVWETDGDRAELTGWLPNGWMYDNVAQSREDKGLSFDGIDLWHYTGGFLPPPAPNEPGLIYPASLTGEIDFLRVVDPGRNYWDIAYDCVTFPVKVVWIGRSDDCEIIAFEVVSNAPCHGAPERRLLRTTLPDFEPPPLATKLPLLTATADRIWTAPTPLVFEDSQDSILWAWERPLAFYRLLGPGDTPLGNILRATKAVDDEAVVISD